MTTEEKDEVILCKNCLDEGRLTNTNLFGCCNVCGSADDDHRDKLSFPPIDGYLFYNSDEHCHYWQPVNGERVKVTWYDGTVGAFKIEQSDVPRLICLLCEKPMDNLDPNGNQPSGGTEFYTSGHYGSAVTDNMDGSGYAVNICDPCLCKAGKKKLVMRVIPPESTPRPRPTYHVWDGQ